jgi:hypothetical protein
MLRRVLAQQVLPASNYYDGEDYYRENEGARGRDYNPPKHPYFGHEHELDGSSEGSSDDDIDDYIPQACGWQRCEGVVVGGDGSGAAKTAKAAALAQQALEPTEYKVLFDAVLGVWHLKGVVDDDSSEASEGWLADQHLAAGDVLFNDSPQRSLRKTAAATAEEEDDPRLQRLLERMDRELPGALKDLDREGSKKGHWAWWAWPTEREGDSEPHPPTAITTATAPELLRSAPPVWREILEKVCELIDGNGGSLKKVIPSIDWGRIEHFVKFFEALPDADKPEWLKNRVLPCLKAAVAKSVNKTTMMSSMKFGGQRRTVNMSRF